MAETISTPDITNCKTTNALRRLRFIPNFDSPFKTLTGCNDDKKNAGYAPANKPPTANIKHIIPMLVASNSGISVPYEVIFAEKAGQAIMAIISAVTVLIKKNKNDSVKN